MSTSRRDGSNMNGHRPPAGSRSTPGEQRSTPGHEATLPPSTTSSTQSARATHNPGASPRATVTAPAGSGSGSGTPTAAPSSPSKTAIPVERVRPPNPAKRVAPNPALDEIRSAVTRDALREEAQRPAQTRTHPQSGLRNETAAPGPADKAGSESPSMPPNMNPPASRAATMARAYSDHAMPRNPSIDSTVSSISNASNPQRSTAYKVSQDASSPQDIAALLASAGSPEAAVQKLINEKNQAASHNAQLWRLVEKQRSMILGLNKDLEKALKEKERYRRKLKEQMVQAESAPSLATANQQLEEMVMRDNSQSPIVAEDSTTLPQPPSLRDISIDSHKLSDASDAASLGQGRAETPQDTSNAPSSVLPATPQSAGSANAISRDPEPGDITEAPPTAKQANVPPQINVERLVVQTPPISPRMEELQRGHGTNAGHHKEGSLSSHSGSPHSFSSPKMQASRKAPPAPLDLTSKKKPGVVNVTNNIIDASDSEYEEDPESARMEQSARGRRKTREDDDREREAIVRQQEFERSRSKKDKKSKSKSKTAAERPHIEEASATSPAEDIPPAAPEHKAQMASYDTSTGSGGIVEQRAIADTIQRSLLSPGLMSPGLPMSPRPGDRPQNAAMPRAPNKILNSIPMSPKSGVAGLPLSPRAPRQPIPMPPQTPLSFASPHLARAEVYQQQMMQNNASMAQSKASASSSPIERPSTSSNTTSVSPGEIYRGLTTEHYPDLLLPPNALPSIYIRTSSSRMKPSRMSYMGPKTEDNPVFTLAVHQRSDNKQLWRVEKTLTALAILDEHIKAVSAFRDRLPDKTLFNGHAPARIDARRAALDNYFDRMLDTLNDEKAAVILCKYLSTDALAAVEGPDYFSGATGSVDLRPDTPQTKARPHREGYLTKRGKNFGGWKARYFILDGPMLKYFDTQGGAQLGSIKLQNAQIGKQSNNGQANQEDEDNQFRHAFLILEPKKKDSSALVRHVLCAESDEERDIWVDALLQYVDFRDDDEDVGAKAVQPPKQDHTGPRSPRLMQSFGDLRPPSRNQEVVERKVDGLRAVGYDDTVAGDAPIIGPGRKTGTPSPPYDGNFGPAVDQSTSSHPTISGPTNLQVISNTSDWGMRPPPTPHGKDNKKRSIFSGFRGRSSSDLGPGEKVASPGLPPQDHYATGYSGRAVFGVPLAEAVEFARVPDSDTELPAVVYRSIEYLLAKNAIREEGIFRLSGSNTVIKGLKDRFNSEGDVNLAGDGKFYDIHAVASLLKLYLRELPSPILTRELHLEFLHCLEMNGRQKVVVLNGLVGQLPRPNRALLDALSSFLLMIVSNADVNKMNVRNVGIVFAPTLNVPAPLISSFVEDKDAIFGPPMEPMDAAPPVQRPTAPVSQAPTDLRSPRKQMFSDLPTPAYNQTTFQHVNQAQYADDTGMIPMHPTYANYQMAPQGDGGFGSLNDALRSPTVFQTVANGQPSSREVKSKRRESGMLGFNIGGAAGARVEKKVSLSRLREQQEEGASF